MCLGERGGDAGTCVEVREMSRNMCGTSRNMSDGRGRSKLM